MFVRLSMKLVRTLYLLFVGMESVPRAGPEANHDIINKNIAVTTAAARFSTPPRSRARRNGGRRETRLCEKRLAIDVDMRSAM